MDKSLKPTKKVTKGGLAGLGVAAVISILKQYDIEVPPEVAAFAVAILGPLTSYIVKD